MPYRHTPEMGTITPVGGDYEKTCQDMFETGVDWILAHPDFEFSAEGYQNVVGIVYPNNEATQDLMNAVIAASDGQADGAQVHAVMLRLAFVANQGWEAYVTQCKKVIQ